MEGFRKKNEIRSGGECRKHDMNTIRTFLFGFQDLHVVLRADGLKKSVRFLNIDGIDESDGMPVGDFPPEKNQHRYSTRFGAEMKTVQSHKCICCYD